MADSRDPQERQQMQLGQEEAEQLPREKEPPPREGRQEVELQEPEEEAARPSPRVSPPRRHAAHPPTIPAEHTPGHRRNRNLPPTRHDCRDASLPAEGYDGESRGDGATTHTSRGAQENGGARSDGQVTEGPAAASLAQQQAPSERPQPVPQPVPGRQWWRTPPSAMKQQPRQAQQATLAMGRGSGGGEAPAAEGAGFGAGRTGGFSAATPG
ncbi:unnamed protein product [Closterium sp. Naga37s-1]|nr:unnamed protein product [Closterium sp. Naga37s-1]